MLLWRTLWNRTNKATDSDAEHQLISCSTLSCLKLEIHKTFSVLLYVIKQSWLISWNGIPSSSHLWIFGSVHSISVLSIFFLSFSCRCCLLVDNNALHVEFPSGIRVMTVWCLCLDGPYSETTGSFENYVSLLVHFCVNELLVEAVFWCKRSYLLCFLYPARQMSHSGPSGVTLLFRRGFLRVTGLIGGKCAGLSWIICLCGWFFIFLLLTCRWLSAPKRFTEDVNQINIQTFSLIILIPDDFSTAAAVFLIKKSWTFEADYVH